jgi:hypothetical protein
MKTVELIPTWEVALRIVSMRLSAAKTRKEMAEAVKVFEESFLPLCRSVDQRNEEIRKVEEETRLRDAAVCEAMRQEGSDSY